MKTLHKLSLAKRFSIIVLIALLFSSCHNQEVIVDQIPLNTPANTDIYITGNFNNWDPGDEKFRMTRNQDGTFSIIMPKGIGKLRYKFTRGDWTRVEKNECGFDIEDRTLNYGEFETIKNQVACWGDTEPMNCRQTVFVVKDFPANTPGEAVIYLASQFNAWNPGDLKYTLQKHPEGFYYINIAKQAECIEYKFTLGDWNSVETDGRGKDIENRKFCFDGRDTLFVGIKEWKSIAFRKLRNITIVLDRIPEPEKSGDRYFIAGDFNNWQPGDMAYVFKNDLAGKPYVNISTDQAIISFKITRGTWNTVETRPSGEDIENRTFICGQDDTLKLKVERWKDRAYKPTISKPQ
jgi:hypothetical protein